MYQIVDAFSGRHPLATVNETGLSCLNSYVKRLNNPLQTPKNFIGNSTNLYRGTEGSVT